MRTHAIHVPRRSVLCVAIVPVLWGTLAPARADTMAKVWRRVYAKVHPGEEAPWLGMEDAIAWVQAERDKVEPIVLRIIRGEEPEIQWTGGVTVARDIPSPVICELLVTKTREVLDRAPNGRLTHNSVDERGLVNMLDILVQQRHEAVRSFVRELAAQPGQSSLLIEHCLVALRQVGTKEDLELVAEIASRHMNPHIDTLCAFTQKVIREREAGRDIFADAEEELREVTARFILAVEQRDFASFTAIHPYGFREVVALGAVDEEEFAREILGHPDMDDLVRALKAVAGREEFQIDRDNYQATLIVEGRYQFTYVLEVDGWKIHGPIRVGP